jgi:hypothetical protein
MTTRSTLTRLVARIAFLSAVAGSGVATVQALTAQDLQRKVERVAPPYTTLPGKVLCSCPQTGFLSRAVGYLNSIVTDHGSSVTVDVWCVYQAFNSSGDPVLTTACADFRLLK